MDINKYVEELNRQYHTGLAREHSYRPALKELLQSLLPNMVVTNEPARFECGAPDFIISREKDNLPIFFVEAKDVGDTDLDGNRESQHKEQFDRYKQALDHIFFTDYLDFHLYENGEFVDSVRIADIKGDRIVAINEVEDKFLELIQHVSNSAMQRISSASKLAKLMAGKARLLANIIKTAMEDNAQTYANDNLQAQYKAFKDILIHDLEQDEFADIYAQTIAYGMFAARLHDDDTHESFSREKAARLIPKSNPFLRQFFNHLAGNDLDERISWVVDDLVALFAATDIRRIMTSYGRNKRHHDPMIHFYEDFLAEYNPALRKSKGVWYTPQPVVRFIVRAVDEILQRDFGLEEGLADYSMIKREVAAEQSFDNRTNDGMKHIMKSFHRIQILDPATGTGTFLAEVINHIYDRFRNQQGIWQQYVENHLIPRLHGFEVLMASYAVAHLKLDMLLGETGYQHKTDKRLHVYLTNSLEDSNSEPRSLFSQWLAREAAEANVIKRDYPVMVIIGNPPYSGKSKNKGKWIMSLMESYKKEPGGKAKLNERNPKWLNNDYVKFIRLAQDYIDKNGEGIIGFINPHGYLDDPTFRGMRWNLLKTFDKIYTIDLHGNSKKKETCLDGSKDENVFDITIGVSINLFVKTGKKAKDELGRMYHKDLYGLRQSKYDFLDDATIESVGYKEITPQAPMYFFVPKDFELEGEYNQGISVVDLFSITNVGVFTANDKVLISQDKETLCDNVRDNYHIEVSDLRISKVTYRPFDNQYIYYDTKLVERSREKIMYHMRYKDNMALLVGRQGQVCGNNIWNLVYTAKGIIDLNVFYRGGGNVFPLYLYQENLGEKERIVNFNKDLYKKIAERLNYQPCYDDKIFITPTSDYDGVLYPQALFDYIYAVLHSPSYRECYKEFLKIDFPRIPYPNNAETYHNLASKGAQLRHLHLMESLPNETGVTFPVAGSMQVDCYRWHNDRVYINADQYFENVPESAWKFYIGGYQPAQKWLKDRKSRTLSFEDVKHYERIIYVLLQTAQIMSEIDALMLQDKCQ